MMRTGVSTAAATCAPGRIGRLLGCAALLAIVSAGRTGATDAGIQFHAAKSPAGLSFHYRNDASTPFAAISFGLRDLYSVTRPGKEGLPSLGGALVMQGADGAGQTEFTERLKDLTASATFSIGQFVTQGNVRAPAATLSQATALMAAALKRAEPTEKVLARLKQRANGAEAQSATRAETMAQRAALQLALGDHPVVRSLDPGRFDRVERSDLADWRNRMLDRTKLRIAVSGRIEEAVAGRIVDEAFADLPEKLEPLSFKWPTSEISSRTVVIEHDTPQSAVVMIGATSISGGREAEMATLANAVLGGGGGSSRLWQSVRVALGSTYGASSGFQLAGPGRRLFRMSAAVANDQVKASVDALRGAYATWRSDGITVAEQKSAVTRILTDFKSAFDEPARANGLVLGMLLSGRAVDEIMTFEARMTAISQDRINTFIVAKFPFPEALLTVIVTPRADGIAADCVIRSVAEIERCRQP